MAVSLQAYACLLSAACFLCTVLRPVATYLRDPLALRRFPSPTIWAGLTPFWLIKVTWLQNRSQTLHEEFKRHGDVLRVSPDNTIFNDPRAIKDIYGVAALSRGIAKDEIYDRMAGDQHDLVQVRDRAEHAERRKAIANAFAAKTVVNMESVIRDSVAQLIAKLDTHVEEGVGRPNTSLNLRRWFNFFTLDVIGDTGFGAPMGFLPQLSDATLAEKGQGASYQVQSMIDSIHRGVRYGLTVSNIPYHPIASIVKRIVSCSSYLSAWLGHSAASHFENICKLKLNERIRNGAPDRPSLDFMHFILKERLDLNGEALPKHSYDSLVADTMMVMNAGSDTTAAALSSTIWFLLRHPHALRRLRNELICARQDMNSAGVCAKAAIFEYDTVKDLPYLRACIDESLRLRPPIAYQLPRLVSRPVKIAGHDILPGTVVAVAPYSVHRHASLYADPEEWKPERWLEFDTRFPTQREDLKTYSIVFSQGSRACIGRHLAIVELQILVPTLVMRYDLSLTGASSQELEIYERFNSNPGPMHVNVQKRKCKEMMVKAGN